MKIRKLSDLISYARNYGIELVFKRFYSFYPATVINNNDPDNQGKLFLNIPLKHENGVKEWVKARSPISGDNWGTQFLPRVGDTVMVSFRHGDLSYPRWEYNNYSKNVRKPEVFKSSNVYGFQSPKGHSAIIDDDNDVITLKHKQGYNVVIDDKGVRIGKDEEETEELALSKPIEEILSDIMDILQNGLVDSATSAPIIINPAMAPKILSINQKINQIKTTIIKSK